MGFGTIFSSYRPIRGTFESDSSGRPVFTVTSSSQQKVSLVVRSCGFFHWLFSSNLVRLRISDTVNPKKFRVVYVTASSVRQALGMQTSEQQGLGRAIASVLHGMSSAPSSLPQHFRPSHTLVHYATERHDQFTFQAEDCKRFREMGLKLPKEYIGATITRANRELFWTALVQHNMHASIYHPKDIAPEEVEFLREFRQRRDNHSWYVDRRGLFEHMATVPGAYQDAMVKEMRKIEVLQARLMRRLPQFAARPLMGRVLWVDPQFGFHMPGLALAASFRAEKKGLKGLYVCEQVQAFARAMEDVARGPDGKFAFIIPVLPSGRQQMDPLLVRDYPQHKVAVCVEKHGHELNVAIMDPEPLSDAWSITPGHLVTRTDDPWEGCERSGAFTSNELILRALRPAVNICTTHVHIARPHRETSFGCAVFALHDAETFLQDRDFFSRIVPSRSRQSVYSHDSSTGRTSMDWQTIEAFPPDYMVGTQSLTALWDYEREHPSLSQQPFVTKDRTLKEYAKKYHRPFQDHMRNQYIMWKAFCFSHLMSKALHTLQPEDVQSRIHRHLLSM
jgi:hypothetical protein